MLQGVANGSAATRRLLQGTNDNVTVYYDVGGVPQSDISSLPDTLNASATLATFRQLLVQDGEPAFCFPLHHWVVTFEHTLPQQRIRCECVGHANNDLYPFVSF